MSSSPASASSSSSQSSSDSWQPSQEANFHTASCAWRSQLGHPHQRLDDVVAEHGPSLQMNSGPSWQCPQCPMAHFMLRSSESQIAVGAHAALAQRGGGEAHHHLGAAHHRDDARGVEDGARDQPR